ncbi:MAG TPA: hypothetical protein QF850_01740 [Acidimicrobiales bacterium]|nr:hypothetical protein [Acidimicrobiales bacterium]
MKPFLVLLLFVCVSCAGTSRPELISVPTAMLSPEEPSPEPTVEPTPIPIPTPSPKPTPTPDLVETIDLGYMGFSGERPHGLVTSACTPETIYGKVVQGVQEHIDRYDRMCEAAKQEGKIFAVRSAFRNYYDQLDYYTSERFGPSVALHPDESMHVAGMAIDLTADHHEWRHTIIGCYSETDNSFSYLPEEVPHLLYAENVRNGVFQNLCEQDQSMIPIKRTMLYGLAPGCTDLNNPEWWGDPEVIECSSATLLPNGMVREDWHFENATIVSAFVQK